MALSSQSNNQKSLAKTPKQCFSQTTNYIKARLVITPHIQTTTCNRLLLSHLFPHNYNVPNIMLHDALNRQKHLPLSTSFHASIMQHVHLELHYRHHPTQAFTGLPLRGSLLPTPIGSTHHLCMKLIHVPTEHTLQYYKIILKNVKRCRDGNVCEVYVIPFLFGSFFTVCHPYIDVATFLEMFFLIL